MRIDYFLCLEWTPRANVFLTIYPAILASEICPLEWEFSQELSCYKKSISLAKHFNYDDDELTEVGRQAGDQMWRSTDSESLEMEMEMIKLRELGKDQILGSYIANWQLSLNDKCQCCYLEGSIVNLSLFGRKSLQFYNDFIDKWAEANI